MVQYIILQYSDYIIIASVHVNLAVFDVLKNALRRAIAGHGSYMRRCVWRRRYRRGARVSRSSTASMLGRYCRFASTPRHRRLKETRNATRKAFRAYWVVLGWLG